MQFAKHTVHFAQQTLLVLLAKSTQLIVLA